MMRKLLSGMCDVINYIDDILIFTATWDEHIEILREVLSRLRMAGLTARPTKCYLGFESLDFLGHIVGEGVIKPQPDKVRNILAVSRPTTKKQVRSFLAKGKGEKNIAWGEPQERAFVSLKNRVAASPILHLPDPKKTFIVRTDASDIGLGAVLMQTHDGVEFPVCFASRKLLPRRRAYSTIEGECLALVWAIENFRVYLYGRQFILQTDHTPLTYTSQAKSCNSRVICGGHQPYNHTDT